MAGNKLIQTIQNMAKTSNGENINLLFGEVTSISPLRVKIDNRFEIDEQFLILSSLVREANIQIPNLGNIVLWRGLEIGDKVRILNLNNGQIFYIMEREGV